MKPLSTIRKTNEMAKIWALTDDRMGNISQVLGVAEALDEEYERKEIKYNAFVKLPNLLRGRSLLGVSKESRIELTAPWPDLVIAAGRRLFPVARFIKKKSGNKTKIVQLMNPGSAGFSEADLVVLPMHDGYRGHAKNVMQTLGAPHRVTKERLTQELEKWRSAFEKYSSPRISVIVGGATKKAPFTVEMAERLASDVLFMNPASILVTTSRRTPKEVVSVLKKRFPKEQTYFYEFGDSGENPYFGLLAWGTKIVVTGDSMSMCSEACASGVPVYIFAPPGTMGKKHMRFHQELVSSGYASILGSGQTAFGGSLNAAADIAEKIKSLFSQDPS